MRRKLGSIGLCVLMLFLLSSCANPKSLVQKNIPFEARTISLVEREGTEPNTKNEYFLFENTKDVQKALDTLNKTFDVRQAPENGTTLEEAMTAYDTAFFKEHTLLFVKRLHLTQAPLQLRGVDFEKGTLTVHATLEAGHPAEEQFRAYLLELPAQFRMRDIEQFDLDVEDVIPPQKEPHEEHLVMVFGHKYKVITDDAYAEKIVAGLDKYAYKATDFDPDKRESDVSDIVFLGPNVYGAFTKQCIDYRGAVYAPDETLQNALLQFYLSLEYPEESVQDSPESDNLDEKA